MVHQKQQVNCRISFETYQVLLALSDGIKHKCCPTCGEEWNLNKQVKTDPVPYSVFASRLLEDAITDTFDRTQYGGKDM